MQEKKFIDIEYNGKRFSIDTKEILYIEKQESEITIHTESTNYELEEKSSSIKMILKEENFFKCSNSHIVNLDKSEFYLSNNCIFVGNNFIRILGTERKNKLRKKLKKLYDYND